MCVTECVLLSLFFLSCCCCCVAAEAAVAFLHSLLMSESSAACARLPCIFFALLVSLSFSLHPSRAREKERRVCVPGCESPAAVVWLQAIVDADGRRSVPLFLALFTTPSLEGPTTTPAAAAAAVISFCHLKNARKSREREEREREFAARKGLQSERGTFARTRRRRGKGGTCSPSHALSAPATAAAAVTLCADAARHASRSRREGLHIPSRIPL